MTTNIFWACMQYAEAPKLHGRTSPRCAAGSREAGTLPAVDAQSLCEVAEHTTPLFFSSLRALYPPHTPNTHTEIHMPHISDRPPPNNNRRAVACTRAHTCTRMHARTRAHTHKQPQPHSVYPIHTACAYRVTIPRANECHLPKLHEAWHTSTCAHDDAARFADEMRSRCDTC